MADTHYIVSVGKQGTQVKPIIVSSPNKLSQSQVVQLAKRAFADITSHATAATYEFTDVREAAFQVKAKKDANREAAKR